MIACADLLAVTVPPLVAAAAGTRRTRVLRRLDRYIGSGRRPDFGSGRTGLAGVEVVPQRDGEKRIEAHAEPLGVGIGLGFEIVRKTGCRGHWWRSGVNVTPFCHHKDLSSLTCFRWDKTLACGSLSVGPRSASRPRAGAGVGACRPRPDAARKLACGRPRSPCSDPTRGDGSGLGRSRKSVLMARRTRIRQAIERARVRQPGAPPSLPLGGQCDPRSGTPPSVPGTCGDLSGVTTPAPAWPSSPSRSQARFGARTP